VQTSKHTPDLGNDDLHACATINADNLLSVQVLNTTVTPLEYQLQIGEQYARVTIPANALQTLRISLPEAR
jgi:glucosylceramidase